MIFALLIGTKLAPQIIGGLIIRVLEVVLAIGRGLPDVDDSVGNTLLGDEVGHGAVHERHLSVGRRVLDDRATGRAEGCMGRPEGPEDGGGGGDLAGFVHVLVSDLINERFEADDVGHTLALIPLGVTDLANGVHKIDARHPLVHGEFHLTGEIMHMPDEGRQDHSLAFWALGANGVDDMLGEVGVESFRHCEIDLIKAKQELSQKE